MVEEDEAADEWRRSHRKAAQSLDFMIEGVRLRDLNRTPTQQDPGVLGEGAGVRLRKMVRARGKSF